VDPLWARIVDSGVTLTSNPPIWGMRFRCHKSAQNLLSRGGLCIFLPQARKSTLNHVFLTFFHQKHVFIEDVFHYVGDAFLSDHK
jgi:hypothetical protein